MLVLDKNTKVPIFAWSTQEDVDAQTGAIQQAINVANHPLACIHVVLCPDFHQGYGVPIGGVFATTDGVVPNAVGVDIGCGMLAARLEIEAAALTPEMLQEWRVAVHANVPVGMTHHVTPLFSLDDMRDPAGPVTREHLNAGRFQLGTLGSGNHFIELQADEEGSLWLMLHSGSRNMGKKVCDFYHAAAKKLMLTFHTALPTENGVPVMDLAFLPRGIPLYDDYLAEMRWCMTFAEDSRLEMYRQSRMALAGVLGRSVPITEFVSTHHNYAQMENYFGKNYLVHRKGAVQAKGLVTIPGSMGTASYIARGLENSASFCSCAHGAGRVMGRKVANKTITHERAVESMGSVVFGVRQGDYDEMPDAYKDVHQVMANQSDLVTPVYKLRPLAVVKG